MGNYDNIVKTEEIRKKVEEGDLLSAQQILDTMELKKIKNISDLNLFAEVYKENERYDDSADLYLKIYEKTKTRKTTYQLIDISIKRGDAKSAELYLEQYIDISPEDIDGYIFRYKIDKMYGASYEKLIETLIALKKIDYTEKWAYELSKLYYKAGMEAECIRECSDIVLWFGEGIYVEKAKMLRSYYLGETDKEKLIEELKRRSEAINSRDTKDTLQEAKGTEESAENVYTGSDFMAESEEEGFVDELSKNIQDILVEEENSAYYLEEEYEGQYEEYIVDQTGYQTENQTGYQMEEVAAGNQCITYAEESYLEDTDTEDTDTEDTDTEDTDTEDAYTEEIESEEIITEETYTEDSYRQEANTNKQEQFSDDLALKAKDQVAVDINDSQQDQDFDANIILSNIAKEFHVDLDEIFGTFLQSDHMKEQLGKSFEIILKANSQSVCIIIAGAEGTDKTALSKDMALFLNIAGKLKSSKVAKISAEKLNLIDIETKKETLRNCCLVIENASVLKQETIDKLLKVIQQLHGEIAVILEINELNLNQLCSEAPTLMDLFKNIIYLS